MCVTYTKVKRRKVNIVTFKKGLIVLIAVSNLL